MRRLDTIVGAVGDTDKDAPMAEDTERETREPRPAANDAPRAGALARRVRAAVVRYILYILYKCSDVC